MHTPIHRLLAAPLLFLPFVAALHAEDWKLVFEDDFDRDTIGMDWDVTRGDWRIEDGRLAVTRMEGWSSDSIIRLMRPLPGNVRVEFDFETSEPSTLAVVLNTGEQGWGGGGARPVRGDGPEPEPVRAQLVAVTAGEGADVSSPQFAIGKRHQAKAEFVNGTFRAWIDGELVKEEKVDIGACPYNDTIEWMTYRSVSLDHVKVYADDAEPPSRWAGNHAESNAKANVRIEDFAKPGLPCAGIQAAIDALPASGGVVLIPAGRFEVRQPIFPRPGVTIRGVGRETVISMPNPMVFSKTVGETPADSASAVVEDASGFVPGMVITAGGEQYSFLQDQVLRVKSVEGNTVHFNRPVGEVWPEGRMVANWFPLIWAEDTSEIEIRDLTLDGRVDDPAPFKAGYGICALSFFRVRDWRVDNLHVAGWKADALSFQGGRNAFLTNCNVQRAANHGYHPGSLQRHLVMSRLVAEKCGGDGFFWCRYNQESVANFNRFSNNQGHMFGGLAGSGDRYNVMNYNLGVKNVKGMIFDNGANNSFMNNVVVDSGGEAVGDLNALVPITGGTYNAPLARQYNIYSGPTRNTAIVDNTIVNTLDLPGPVHAFDVGAGAASLVIAGNRYFGKTVTPPAVQAPDSPHSVFVDNEPLPNAEWKAPETLPEIPAPKEPVVNGAKYYDASAPDQGFQKALDELAAKGGGTLLLPAGRFRLEAPLTIPSNTTLMGEGLSTVLIGTDASRPLIVSEGATSVGLRRLWLVGTGAPIAPARAEDAPLAKFSECQGVLIVETDFRESPGAGLDLTNCSDMQLRMNRLWRTGDGYQITGGSGLFVAENQALESQVNGIAVREVSGPVRIVGNIVWYSHEHGILVETEGPVRVDANVIATSGKDGVVFRGTKDAQFTGNAMLNSSLAGRGQFAQLLLDNAGSSIIRGNRIGDEFFDTIIGAAVRETGESNQNTVTFNVLCPDYWPETASLDGLVLLKGAESKASDNVLYPYPKP